MTSALLLACWLSAEIRLKPGDSIPNALARLKPGEANVLRLAPGDYRVSQTLVLDQRHSGLRIEGKDARLLGGYKLSKWRPLRDAALLARLTPEARKHVVVADLPTGPAPLASRGFSRPTTPSHSELYFDGERMTLARWPNNGEFTRIASTADPEPPDDGHGKRLGRIDYGFRYEGDRPSRWNPSKDHWVHGYWAWDWAETYERIEELDTASKLIKTAAPKGLYGFRGGQRYYFLNIFEELDSAGEYYIDPIERQIYFWPPTWMPGKEIAVSDLGDPILRINGVRNVTIDSLRMQYTRGSAIVVEDSQDIRMIGLDLTDIGNNGIVVRGGARVSVEHSHIAYTGDGGIELTGGDRKTLTPAGHRATDNHLHDFGEWSKTYNPAIKINGVGNVLAHNHIHDAPHAGILLTGNDHRIEYNHMHHLARETGDVGAFYLGRDYTERGNVVRHNYIHHMGGVGSIGSMAVYLDDCSSGTTVFGNIFYKVQRAAFIGGGRDNIVENNLFIDCVTPVHVDSRGLSPREVWQNMVYKTMQPKVAAMQPDQPPYSTLYPELRQLEQYFAKPGFGVPPEGNRIRRNVVFGGGAPWIKIHEKAPDYVKDLGDNLAEAAIGVVNVESGDFTFKDPEGPKRIGFQPIPWREIGPRPRPR
jgi:hypothetical protein